MSNAFIESLPYSDFRKGLISWEDFKKPLKLSEMNSAFNEITPNSLASLFVAVERQELRVDSILLNQNTYSSIRKWGRDILDIESCATLLREGLMGNIWGAKIFVNKNIPNSVILALSEEELKIGVFLNLGQEKILKLEDLGLLM
jgi:hypothetical protein